MDEKKIARLGEKLPDWAIKSHPTKQNMTVIHPMAVVERLNDVFGVGGWNFTTDYLSCEEAVQQTKKGPRKVFMSAVRGRLEIPKEGIKLEQYGGSMNDDKGDALKGGATDALTKIASYLNVGAEIYKGKGNEDYGTDEPDEEAIPTPRQRAEKDIEAEDDIFGLRNLESRINESTKLSAKDKQELSFIIKEKLDGMDPTK